MAVDEKLASEQWMHYCYLRDNGHLSYVQKAQQCDDFVLGQQWDSADLARLQQQRRPALTINKILPTLLNVQGDQINTRADVNFKAKKLGGEDLTDVLDKLFLHIAGENDLGWLEAEVFADGIITSRGFFDVRLSFKDNIHGEVDICALNPRNVLIDADAEDYDPEKWKEVIISKWLSPSDIRVLYSAEDADFLKITDGDTYRADFDMMQQAYTSFRQTPSYRGTFALDPEIRRSIRVIERQHIKVVKSKFFVDMETGETREVPENWDRNKISMVMKKFKLGVIDQHRDRIRWTVTAGPCVLHDEWSPYDYYTVVPFFPVFRRGRTAGVVENLIGPQELLNKVSSQELHVVNTTANSGWKIKTGSLRNMSTDELEQRGAQTGVVLELDDINNADKIAPNPTPTGLDRISYKAEEHIKSISNVTDNALGNDREDVAAKAIKQKRERGSVNMLKILDNLNYTRTLLARRILCIVQRFYSEPRVYRITKDELTGEQDDLQVNYYDDAVGRICNDLTMGEYDVVITTTPHRDTVQETEFEQALALMQLGLPIPPEVLIENSHLKRKRDIIKQMRDKAQSPEAQQAAQLQSRAQQLQVEDMDAKVDQTRADAALKAANAQKAVAEAHAGSNESPENPGLEMAKMDHEATQNQADRDLKREEMQHETAQSDREHAQTVQQGQIAHEQGIEQAHVQHQLGVAAADQQHAQGLQSSALQNQAKTSQMQVQGDQKQHQLKEQGEQKTQQLKLQAKLKPKAAPAKPKPKGK
jgi:hypothetical protein